ncbi:unnamed protein product [Cunninghamella echinulata]
MTSMVENHRRDYSDDEDIDDNNQRGLLSNQTSSIQLGQQYYYPNNNDIENGEETGLTKPKRKIHTTCIALVTVLIVAWIIWSFAMGQILQLIFGDEESVQHTNGKKLI